MVVKPTSASPSEVLVGVELLRVLEKLGVVHLEVIGVLVHRELKLLLSSEYLMLHLLIVEVVMRHLRLVHLVVILLLVIVPLFPLFLSRVPVLLVFMVILPWRR